MVPVLCLAVPNLRYGVTKGLGVPFVLCVLLIVGAAGAILTTRYGGMILLAPFAAIGPASLIYGYWREKKQKKPKPPYVGPRL